MSSFALPHIRANKLTLNVDKSVFLMFNRKGQRSINQLKLGDSLINRVSSTKFLGTWVDDQLNWKTHMSRLLSKLKCGLGMLQRSSDLLSPKPRNSCITVRCTVISVMDWGSGVQCFQLGKQKNCALFNVNV